MRSFIASALVIACVLIGQQWVAKTSQAATVAVAPVTVVR